MITWGLVDEVIDLLIARTIRISIVLETPYLDSQLI